MKYLSFLAIGKLFQNFEILHVERNRAPLFIADTASCRNDTTFARHKIVVRGEGKYKIPYIPEN